MHNEKHPNILFLISDQQQQATIAPGSPCQMPNIGRLRDSGVMFSQARTVNAICSPARASLMTGLFPHNHGLCHGIYLEPVVGHLGYFVPGEPGRVFYGFL